MGKPLKHHHFQKTSTVLVAILALMLMFITACGPKDSQSQQSTNDGMNHIGQNEQTDTRGHGDGPDDEAEQSGNETDTENGTDAEDAEQEPEPYTVEAKLIAVGDIMMHSPQIPGAYDAETKTYSFDHYFTEVKALMQGDWVVANLETPMAGEENGGYTGYPMFNAPASLADALKAAGVNIVSTANNHSLDRREQGVLKTLEHAWASGLLTVGTHASAEDAEQVLVVEKNEIRMAFLAYTYGTNGIPIPEGKSYLVNLIDEEKIVSDIARARETGADLITVSMHFGNEYHRQPSDEQKRLARLLIESGADIILGSHPHVVQPYEFIEVEQSDGTPRKGIVIYSLGNFISNQGPDQGTAKYTDVGLIFGLTVKKHFPVGTLELGEVTTIPTWVHKYYEDGKRKYRILPIETIVTAQSDPILTEKHYTMLEDYLQEMNKHVQSMAVPVQGTPAQ